MKCFGVEIGLLSSKIKLKAVGELITLETSTSQNIKLDIKINLIKIDIKPILYRVKLKIKDKNTVSKFNANNLIRSVKVNLSGNQLILTTTYNKGIKLNIRKFNDILFILNRSDNIVFICVPSCKLRREYEYLRSLDDESLIDTELYFLKSIIEYGRERFN